MIENENEIVLTAQQEKAKNLISKWWNEDNNQIFVLAGYAGTGKTFLVDYIVKNVLKLEKERVAFVAPTGKAASILIKKGRTEASTIHRLIYNAVEKEYETEIDGKKIKSKKIEFLKVPEIFGYDLLVVDEISMVEEKILEDLMSYGIRILCCGDAGQLPAIFKSNNLLENPDFTLTEIVRQAEDNAIICLATMARNGIRIPEGNYGNGDVIVINRNNLSEDDFKFISSSVDQIICGTNATRKNLNEKIRSWKGIDIEKNKFPLKGEKVICTTNNWEISLDEKNEYSLVNGIILEAQTDSLILDPSLKLGSIELKADFLDNSVPDILFDSSIFSEGSYSFEAWQRAYLLDDGTFSIKDIFWKKKDGELKEDFFKRKKEELIRKHNAISDKQISRIEFAYAISCHKSQGSEFDSVIVFDESFIFRNDAKKWLYTAITRAKKKLIIIR